VKSWHQSVSDVAASEGRKCFYTAVLVLRKPEISLVKWSVTAAELLYTSAEQTARNKLYNDQRNAQVFNPLAPEFSFKL
jgi:hypothetical protein